MWTSSAEVSDIYVCYLRLSINVFSFTDSGYYSRYKRTRDWPPEETIRFYRCLHTIGTDFSMMMQLFPNRSRRDLKLKVEELPLFSKLV